MQHASNTAFVDAIRIPSAPRPTLETVHVLGLPVVSESAKTVIDTLLAPGRRHAFFLNAHCANVRTCNDAYADALTRADCILPDGIGVELAARMQGDQIMENLNGTDFVPTLLHEAARRGLSVFLFGARPGTADAAARKLALTIPGLRIAGTRDGHAGAADSVEVIADINASGADIVLVAMGVPIQEVWIDQYRDQLGAKLVLGVGALFDFLADNVRRAPLPVRRARLEWVWRLAMEPRRMAGRYLVGNVTFLARATAHAVRTADVISVQKRTIDLVLSGLSLVALAPLFLLAILMIRLDSRGPAFFRQTRVGRNGQHFAVYKFRSMYVDAEARRAALLATSDRAGVCFKSRTDPRITRIGRLLRRTSIDELPQILNVFLGQMSIVGPRPALPVEVAAYPDRALERLDVKPGITGVWQVSGRADIGFDKMIDMDLAYVRSRSSLLDFILIALTFRAVFSGRGAY